MIDRGVIALIALEVGILALPFLMRHAKKRDIENIRFACVDYIHLCAGDLRGDEVLLDSVRVDAVVDLRQFPLRRPADKLLLLRLEALELLDDVYLELGGNPHRKLKRNVLMGISPTIASGSGDEAHGVCALRKLLNANLERVESGLAYNFGEFAIIKRRVVDALPDSDELQRIAVTKPICDEELAVLRLKHISKADVVFIADSDYTNHCAFNVQLVRFLHCFVTFL